MGGTSPPPAGVGSPQPSLQGRLPLQLPHPSPWDFHEPSTGQGWRPQAMTWEEAQIHGVGPLLSGFAALPPGTPDTGRWPKLWAREWRAADIE